jgi:hypothetical protein
MLGRLMKVFVAPLLFVIMMIATAWAAGTQVTIIYSNNINGQVDAVG